MFDSRKKSGRRSAFYGFKRGLTVPEYDHDEILLGHHPTCGQFSSHVFRVGDKVFCATCSGLFIGALFVLGGVAYYFLGNSQLGLSAILLVLVGITGIIFGLLLSPVLTFSRSFVRVFSGAFLSIGSYLIIVGIDELANNFFLDVFVVLLTVFWLVTRISLSHWEHEKMCSNCSLNCNLFQRKKKIGD